MDAKLRLESATLGYSDTDSTSNPSLRNVDWSRSRLYDVKNPKNDPFTVDPSSSVDVFDSTRSTSISNTTEFSLALSSLASDRYRFTWSGTGTNPAFRTDRALTLNAQTVVIALNANLTVSLTASAGSFTAVVVGDVIFIPDTTTGDSASPFNQLNVGYWQVLAKDGTSAVLQLSRLFGESFTGYGESVLLSANTQVQGFSLAGVQVGDKVTISAGFSSSVLRTYTVAAINPKWFEVVSTAALPAAATAVPTVAGINFYSNAKRYLRVEGDQECIVRVNGDTGSANTLVPWVTGDKDNMAEYVMTGPVWSLTVVNKSAQPLNLVVISAE